MKDKRYIDKVRILVKSDLQSGNRAKIKALIPKLIEHEDYETLQGIRLAVNETAKNKTIFNR